MATAPLQLNQVKFCKVKQLNTATDVQVVVQGIPWKFTWKELRPMFEECGTIDRAEVVYGRDGRSRVRNLVACMKLSCFPYCLPVEAHSCIPSMLGRQLTMKLATDVQGYGTVRFESAEAANTAIEKFHGTDCEGRTLTVKLDQYA